MAVDNFAIGALANNASADVAKERAWLQQQAQQKMGDADSGLKNLLGLIDQSNGSQSDYISMYDQMDPAKQGLQPGTQAYMEADARRKAMMGGLQGQNQATALPSDPMSFSAYQDAKKKYDDAQAYATNISQGAGAQDELSKKYHTGQTLEGLLMGDSGAGSDQLTSQIGNQQSRYAEAQNKYGATVDKETQFNQGLQQRQQQRDAAALAQQQAQKKAQDDANTNLYNNYLAHRNQYNSWGDTAFTFYPDDAFLKSQGDTEADAMDQNQYIQKHGNADINQWGGDWQQRDANIMKTYAPWGKNQNNNSGGY